MTESFKGFNYEKGGDGIVTVTMDMQGPVNAMNADFREAIAWLADKLEAEDGLKGAILASAKSTFFAGGDIKELSQVQPGEEQVWFDAMERLKRHLRRIEQLPVPVVAAINGAALGGGLEICLACNYRIAWNSPKVQLGFPEVTLGLLPGAGGVVRSIHMLGLKQALPLLLEGTRLDPGKGLKAGLIDATVDSAEELVAAARTWIQENPDAGIKPWDKKGYKIPDGGIDNPDIAQTLAASSPMLFDKTRGLLPAPERILSVAHDVEVVDFDTALRIESRGLVELLLTPEGKNLMNSTFLQMNKVNGGIGRPEGVEKSKVAKVGILGAGMMGQGIAYACATAGLEVVLKDVSQDAADKGKAYTEQLLAKRVDKGRMDESAKAEVLDRIVATASNDELKGCDLIVEAVFEDIDLKGKVTGESEPMLAENGVFGTNTSTLPISLLARVSDKPENFVGIHFFSPVDKMPLIELIRGEKTSDETLARAYDFARQIKKTPIVVNDSPGFFTSRVFCTYLDEGSRLLTEGLNPVFIENTGRYVGMPVGPLAVYDEISLELIRKIAATQRELEGQNTKFDASVATEVAEKMIGDFGRGGRHHGGGFYEYPPEGPKHLWSGLYELYHKPGTSISEQDAKERLLFRQVIESLKCLEEGVLNSVPEGNIGSLMGIGAPSWTGGFIQFVNTYGLERFNERCGELASTYGERFRAPKIVADKLARGEEFV